jgi:hypothetical protein
MALLAEEIVEEWLNRQAFFTIRGLKLGLHEIDLLAVRYGTHGLECRHIEVQASVRPMSYLTDLSKEVQKATGRRPKNAKLRSDDELRSGIEEWIGKKWDHAGKAKLRTKLAPGPWSRELVIYNVRHERELELLVQSGIVVHRLRDIVRQLKSPGMVIEGAVGAHLLDLVGLNAD